MTTEARKDVVSYIKESKPEFIPLSDAYAGERNYAAVLRVDGLCTVAGEGSDQYRAYSDALSNLVSHVDGQGGRTEMEGLDFFTSRKTGITTVTVLMSKGQERWSVVHTTNGVANELDLGLEAVRKGFLQPFIQVTEMNPEGGERPIRQMCAALS